MRVTTSGRLALAVSLLALVVALAGTSYAAVLIGTNQIKNNAVTSPKIKDNTVTGKDVKESSLGKVKSAAKADSVGGTPLSGLLQTSGCQQGKVLGSALIRANSSIPTSFSTSGVDSPTNCSGGTVEVLRIGTGRHVVRFNGNASTQVLVTLRYDNDTADEAACISAKLLTDGVNAGAFQVTTFDCSTDSVVNADFTIVAI